jgi:serine/threonine-protein kinase
MPDGSALPIRGVKVDPAKVDKSPGSVVPNHPRIETVLVGPEDYPVPPIDFAPPDWR